MVLVLIDAARWRATRFLGRYEASDAHPDDPYSSRRRGRHTIIVGPSYPDTVVDPKVELVSLKGQIDGGRTAPSSLVAGARADTTRRVELRSLAEG